MKRVIYIIRHSSYDTSVEEGKGGSLTYEGKVKSAKKILKDLTFVFNTEELKNTQFLVAASQTRWKNLENLGQRAVQTSNVCREAVEGILRNNCGLSDEETKERFIDAPVRSEIQSLIGEPNFWKEAPSYIKMLEERYGGRTKEFWHTLGQVGEEIKQFGENAETSKDISKRMLKAFSLAMKWSEQQKDVNTCVLMVSHGETLQPFYNALGLNFAKTGYLDGVIVEFDDQAEDVIIYDASCGQSINAVEFKDNIERSL